MAYIYFPSVTQHIEIRAPDMKSLPTHTNLKQYLDEKLEYWYAELRKAQDPNNLEIARFVIRAYLDMRQEFYGY